MTTSAYRISVPAELATALRTITEETDRHRLAAEQVAAARGTLRRSPAGPDVADRLAARLTADGWAVLALPYQRHDTKYRRAAAGLLAAIGDPFHSIQPPEGGLWLRGESRVGADPASFDGFGGQGLHIHAPGVERPADYTGLLMLRPDPAGGGASRIANLRQAAAKLTRVDRELLARPMFFDNRTDRLHGVGRPLLPFPILDGVRGDAGWIRWAARLLGDPRNQQHRPVLLRYAELLEPLTRRIWLHRGDLLVLDQRQVAHGRDQLGDQRTVTTARRLLCQADVAATPDAPVQRALTARATTAAHVA